METVLITWSSGFIGYHLVQKLISLWYSVVWIDNENDYYDVSLKVSRREILLNHDAFTFYSHDIKDYQSLHHIFEKHSPSYVVNLAAYAWVRYSMENPFPYIDTNLVWFHNVLELAKNYQVKNFIYASSASVYWSNLPPFNTTDKTDTPLSLYWATKKANELIAHSYTNLFDLKTTWLRFFNVLGPRWRPDWALFLFTDRIAKWLPIQLFNRGKMKRNFTYVGDIIEWIIKSLDQTNNYEIFNLGNPMVVELNYFVERIEQELWMTAVKELIEIQPGEIVESRVDIEHTVTQLGREVNTDVKEMVHEFVVRYKRFYMADK